MDEKYVNKWWKNGQFQVLTGRLLMEKHPSLFWSPCAAHCIDLMLEDVGKIPLIKEVVDQARSITKFIYNHAWVLSLMRRCMRNRELLRPRITRFATNFISLQSLLRVQFELKQMFVRDEWRIAHIAGERMGKPSLDWFTPTRFVKEWRKCAQSMNLW